LIEDSRASLLVITIRVMAWSKPPFIVSNVDVFWRWLVRQGLFFLHEPFDGATAASISSKPSC
jgi:hypothetical protein